MLRMDNSCKLYNGLALQEIVGPQLWDNKGNQVETSVISEATDQIGLLFTAHAAKSTKQFLSKLTKYYEKRRMSRHHKFEIFFISCEPDQKSHDAFFNDMPWLAVPFSSIYCRSVAYKKFSAEALEQTFIIVNSKTGEIVDCNGIDLINNEVGNFNRESRTNSVFK